VRLVNATLVRNEVEPGWPIMRDGVPLGRRYRVDLDRIVWMTMGNTQLRREMRLECVYVLEPTAGWMPLIALKIEADA
jgi:hypothetical protein